MVDVPGSAHRRAGSVPIACAELSDRNLVALHVERIVLRSRRIDITLRSRASPEGQGAADRSSLASITLRLPWTPTSASARKGIAWKPSAQSNLDPARSDLVLTAIARARYSVMTGFRFMCSAQSGANLVAYCPRSASRSVS